MSIASTTVDHACIRLTKGRLQLGQIRLHTSLWMGGWGVHRSPVNDHISQVFQHCWERSDLSCLVDWVSVKLGGNMILSMWSAVYNDFLSELVRAKCVRPTQQLRLANGVSVNWQLFTLMSHSFWWFHFLFESCFVISNMNKSCNIPAVEGHRRPGQEIEVKRRRFH